VGQGWILQEFGTLNESIRMLSGRQQKMAFQKGASGLEQS
jgi:hypothetical protein